MTRKLLLAYPFILIYVLYILSSVFDGSGLRKSPLNLGSSSLLVNAIEVPIPTCNQTGLVHNETDCLMYDPNEAHVPCSEVPAEFRTCYFVPKSCKQFAGRAYEPVLQTGQLNCTVNAGIDCLGDTNFLVYNYPCMFRNGIHFTTVVVTSVFVGLFGVDRFYLGHMCCGLAKLFTLGGIGVWWFVDLVLLLAGVTRPADESSWEGVY